MLHQAQGKNNDLSEHTGRSNRVSGGRYGWKGGKKEEGERNRGRERGREGVKEERKEGMCTGLKSVPKIFVFTQNLRM